MNACAQVACIGVVPWDQLYLSRKLARLENGHIAVYDADGSAAASLSQQVRPLRDTLVCAHSFPCLHPDMPGLRG